MGKQRMSDSYYNFGGWEHSELRGRLNSGDLWALLPAEIQSRAKAVTKMTDNKLDTYPGTVTATTDKVFLLSTTEVYGNLQANGHLHVRRLPVRVLRLQGRDAGKIFRGFVRL